MKKYLLELIDSDKRKYEGALNFNQHLLKHEKVPAQKLFYERHIQDISKRIARIEKYRAKVEATF